MSASVERVEGVVRADVNFASGTLLIEYDPMFDPRPEALAVVRAAGHGIESLEPSGRDIGVEPTWWESHRATIALVTSGALIVVGWLIGLVDSPELAAVRTPAFALAILAGGTITWRRAIVSLRARQFDMNVLMTIAVIGAAAIGEWSEGATVIWLFALGGFLESRSLARTRRSIRNLMDLTPPTVRVRRDGSEAEVPIGEALVGDVMVVRPGERIPLDGTIVSGGSAIDEAPITGESVPVEKGPGDGVWAGSLNTTGLIRASVEALATDSTLSRIIHLVEEAQASRAPSQRLVDRFSRWYTPSVVALAIAIAVVPPSLALAVGAEWGGFAEWLYRALVILVISCPCALVISTPVAIVSAITRATRDGVLVKGGAFLEEAARVRAVAFDKTGTLTCGRSEVSEVVSLAPEAIDAAEVLSSAAVLEANSNHPLARAIVRAAGESVTGVEVTGYRDLPGIGVSGTIAGEPFSVTSPASARDAGVLTPEAQAQVERLEDAGATALVLARGGSAIGVIGVADEVRPATRATVTALRRDGIEHVVMLTGDNERTAAAVAAHAGIDEFRARLLPGDKTLAVEELRAGYGPIAMVGDGVNDAPALASADIGIAMGAAGSDTALETADVALMSDDLEMLPRFFALGRRTVRIIVQNVAASVVIKFAVLVLAITGHATLWMAVFADTGVSLLVIANGLRLLKDERGPRMSAQPRQRVR